MQFDYGITLCTNENCTRYMEKYIIINRGFAVYWTKCTMKCGRAVIYVQDLEPCIFLDKPAGSYRIDYDTICNRPELKVKSPTYFHQAVYLTWQYETCLSNQ